MKRYIMTVEQFLEKSGSCTCEDCIKGTEKQLSDLPTVPDWATHFTCGLLLYGDGENEVDRTQEIPE